MVAGSVVLGKRAGCGAISLLKRPARFERRPVPEREMRPDRVVIVAPERQLPTGVVQGIEDLLVQEFVTQAAVERLDEGVSRAVCPGRCNAMGTPFLSAHFKMARLVNSVPLLGETIPGGC